LTTSCLYRHLDPRHLHSFPTRRSSDLVDGGVIRSLIELHDESARPIVASHYLGTLGIPALFDQSSFAELLLLPDARGAKSVIEKDRKSTRLNSSHRTISYAVFCLKKKT